MSKFRDFFEKLDQWNPGSATDRTFGYDPGLGQLGKWPVGGFQNVSHYAQWKSRENQLQRGFDLTKLAQAMGVNPQGAQAFMQKYKDSLSYRSTMMFLRDLKSKTTVVQIYLAKVAGSTTDQTVVAKIRGAHFRGQDPNTGVAIPGQAIDQNIIEDLDKRLYTLEAGRGEGVPAFEIGVALTCIAPSKNVPGKFDVNISLIEDAMMKFSQLESDFSRRQSYGVLGAGAVDKGIQQMMQPSIGAKFGSNIDASAAGTSGF